MGFSLQTHGFLGTDPCPPYFMTSMLVYGPTLLKNTAASAFEIPKSRHL
jgi:hypothetical protein